VGTGTKIYDVKERTYRYALDVMKFLEGLPDDYIAKTIGRQLLRSATSVGANVIEARASSSKRDFANFYTYSLKSANESKFWLGLLQDSGKASTEQVRPLLDETRELSNILASSILTMKGKKRF
jgi:four helix bundle protein